MYPHTYFLTALFTGFVLRQIWNLDLHSIFSAAILAVLIDLDHFFSYLYHHKKLHLGEAWSWAVYHHKNELTFFHTVRGFFLLLGLKVLLAFLNTSWFAILAIAYWTHIFLDTLHAYSRKFCQQKFCIGEFQFHIRILIVELVLDLALLMGIAIQLNTLL